MSEFAERVEGMSGYEQPGAGPWTRAQFAAAVDEAHNALHEVDDFQAALSAAHDALHRVGAGRPRVDCSTQDHEGPRTEPAWLDRLPTPAEVEAHAAAHPLEHEPECGNWLRVATAASAMIRALCVSDGAVITQHGTRPARPHGERWLPLTAEGLPAPPPIVAAKEGM